MSQDTNHEETTWKSWDSDEGPTQVPPLPCLTILSHPVPDRIGERAYLRALRRDGSDHLSRTVPEFIPPDGAFGKPLADPFLSRKPIVLEAVNGGCRINPPPKITLEANGFPIQGTVSFTSDQLLRGIVLVIENRVCLLLHLSQPDQTLQREKLNLVGESDSIVRVRQSIQRAAAHDLPVLIRGETGTGKELVAQALHCTGNRAGGAFVSVNLAAIPGSLASSELFGAVKGSFTGAARDRKGFFRAAHGGVLFLDEIGEASGEIQAMLLRALETREIYPLGRETPVRVDVRLIAATDANLDAMIGSGSFKAPLLHRLAGFEIKLPPLRQRREDLGRLFLHFAREEMVRLGHPGLPQPAGPRSPLWLPAGLCAALALFPWPGNVRQFRNVVRQLIIENAERDILSPGESLRDLLASIHDEVPSINQVSQEVLPEPTRKPADVTEAELNQALRDNLWEYKASAKQLGISRASLYALIKRYQIPTALDLDEQTIIDAYQQHRGDLEAMAVNLAVSKRGLKRRLTILKLGE